MDRRDPKMVHNKLAEEDHLRAELYNLFAHLLFKSPSQQTLEIISQLKTDQRTPLGKALTVLINEARSAEPVTLSENYEVLFIGIGRGRLIPFASYYLTGFLNEKPLAALRASLKLHGLERRNNHRLPEDHAASILEVMSKLITGIDCEPLRLGGQKSFFLNHIHSWMPHFFKDLGNDPKATSFYRAVGQLGKLFMEIEAAAFELVKQDGKPEPDRIPPQPVGEA